MTGSSQIDNVVVVVMDALRADRVGAYGSDKELTPTLDTLSREATVFDKAFSTINTTDPSITSLHTGKLPRSTVIHHGGLVTEEEKRRIEAVEFLPQLLSDAGVRTVATGRVMGRWHPRGFDEYSWSKVGETEVKISEALQQIHPLLHKLIAGIYNSAADVIRNSSQREETDGVDELLSQINADPYYGFVHLMDTHAWYDADDELVDELLATHDYPDGDLSKFFDEYSYSPVISKLLEPNATEADYETGLSRLFARYDATVKEADEKLEKLIEGLKQRGDWENTALFVLSDHGESLHEHGIYFDHHGLYDQSIHVPLVAHVPGASQKRVEEFVQLHDLAPTILDLFGISGLQNTDGRSLLGYLSQDHERPEPREDILIEEAHTQCRRGLRTDKYKFIEYVMDETVADFWDTDSLECGYCRRQHGDEVELYDLEADPEETKNIAPEHPDLVEELRERTDEKIESIETVTTGDESVTYEDEDEVMERLENLGYR